VSSLVYNGQVLSFISTQSVLFEPVYDDLASVDQMMTRVVLSCTAIIAPGYPPSLPGESAAQTMARVSHLLNAPRRGLIYTVGADTLVSVVAPNGNTTVPFTDAKNGPYARANIARIAGTEALIVTFRAETYVVDCPGQSLGAPLYTSLRWTETMEINQWAMTRRTRAGRLVTRGDMLANADQIRGVVVPQLEPDFARVVSEYTLQADGLAVAFRFVDEEQYLMPPNPAAKAEGRFTISSKDGGAYWAECSLRLQGGKPTDKTILMLRAASIALAKIQSANPPTGKGGAFPVFGSMSEDMFGNDVMVHLTAMIQPAKARATSLSGQGLSDPNTGTIQGGGVPPEATTPRPGVRQNGTAPGISIPFNLDWLKVPQEFAGGPGRFDPGDRGSAGLLALAAALQDECLRQTVLAAAGQLPALRTTPGQTVPAAISIVTLLPPDQQSFRTTNDNESDGVYEQMEVAISNVEDRHIFALPVGKKDADAAIIQTAPPVARRTVEWKAIKVGGPPRVPKPDLKDPNWILTKAQPATMQVEPTADGAVLRYCASGLYEYVAVSAKKAALTTSPTGVAGGPSLVAAVPPWVDATAAGLAFAPFVYADDIVEPGQSSLHTLTGGPIIPGVNG
jgi:hypothetical protein